MNTDLNTPDTPAEYVNPVRYTKARTVKQRRWLKEYIRTGNATEAASIVYQCDRGTAGTIGWQNMKKLAMPIAEILDRAEITDAKIAIKLAEGLDATKVVTSPTEPDREVPDYQTRHKYVETTLKVKKLLGADVQVNNDNRQVTFQVLKPQDDAQLGSQNTPIDTPKRPKRTKRKAGKP